MSVLHLTKDYNGGSIICKRDNVNIIFDDAVSTSGIEVSGALTLTANGDYAKIYESDDTAIRAESVTLAAAAGNYKIVSEKNTAIQAESLYLNSDDARIEGSPAVPDGTEITCGEKARLQTNRNSDGTISALYTYPKSVTLYGTGDTYAYRIDDEARRTWASNWPQESLQDGDPGFYQYRDEIARIVIMPGVRALNLSLFCDMSALNYVDFGTVYDLHQPFGNCSALEYVRLPQSLAFIADGAFNYCANLRSITVEGGSDNIEAGAFGNCPALEEVIFYGNEHIEAGADLLASDSDESRSDHVTFYVKEGSDALRCAQEYNIPYEITE